MEDTLLTIKEETDDLVVEYEILPVISSNDDKRQVMIQNEIDLIDEQISVLDKRLSELNVEIDKLTNHADGIDYLIAVGSGIFTGIIDSLFIGEFDINAAKGNNYKRINNIVQNYAKSRGYNRGKRLKDAIAFLEDEFPVAQDNIWKGANINLTPTNHHLADLAHHPTIIGLGASILVYFVRIGLFIDKNGELHIKSIPTDKKEFVKIWMPVILAGLFNWLVNVAENYLEDNLGQEIPMPIRRLVKMLANAPLAISILKVADNWIGHLFSDVAGSKNTPGGGMGIPGIFISFLHEMSSLPILKNSELSSLVNDLYVKKRVDFRTETAVLSELSRQSIPLLINESLVRGFYFVRHLIGETKTHGINNIDWQKVIPFGNRTITRMITVSMGTFCTIDLADASIRAAIKFGGNPAMFFKNLILRVNFVGVGRFAIAIGTDISMEFKKGKLSSERIALMNKNIMLSNAKVFYKQADVWITLEHTQKSFEELMYVANQSMRFYVESWNDIEEKMKNIDGYIEDIREKDPELSMKMLDLLEW